MKPHTLFNYRPSQAIVTCAALVIAVSIITCLLGAQTDVQHPTTLPPQAPAKVSEDHDALLARLTKILNYGSELGGLGKPGKTDAVIALGLVGDEKAVPALVDHLINEENKHLRLQIVRALGWIGSPQAVPALEQALQDKYPLLRKQAADVLKTITGRDYEYDKTGLLDYKKMQELIRSSANEQP